MTEDGLLLIYTSVFYSADKPIFVVASSTLSRANCESLHLLLFFPCHTYSGQICFFPSKRRILNGGFRLNRTLHLTHVGGKMYSSNEVSFLGQLKSRQNFLGSLVDIGLS